MADVISGGVSSLPGAKWDMPAGATCDSHPIHPAVARIQGETDSMGCELCDVCQECLDAYRAYQQEQLATERYCEWHKGMGLGVRPHRDFEEGTSGRLYDVCSACRLRETEALAADLDENPVFDDYYVDDDD